jgi:signal transduction histidine kinase
MNSASRFGAWCRRYIRPSDVVLALGCLLTIGISGSLSDTTGLLAFYGQTAQALWGLALMVPALFRRWRPQAAAIAFVAICAVQLIAGPAVVLSDALAMVMLYSAIVYGRPENTRRFIVLALIMGALAALVMAWSTIGPLHSAPTRSCLAKGTINCLRPFALTAAAAAAGILICLGSTIIIAYWTRARLATVRLLQERNASIEAREGEERRIAALAERARIARDMHDVVAHTLSIIIVQSDGGRYAGTHDPAVARSTMETIRHESEHALHDMRRVLGALGGSAHADYSDIGTLLTQARAASPDCRFARRITGMPAAERLDATASVALYHAVQESLTNIRKYAGPKVNVLATEAWDESGVHVTVSDDGRGAGAALDGHASGYGLVGMRERIEAAHGTLSAGPQLGGGFAVHAFVPYAGYTVAQSVVSGVETGNSNIASHSYDSDDAHGFPNPAFGKSHSEFGDIPSSETQRTYARTFADGSGDAGDDQPHAFSGTPGDVPPNAGTSSEARDSHIAYGTGNGNSNMRPREPDFSIVLKTRLSDITHMLRSKPIGQASSQEEGRFNWVERLSRWTERHYLLIDIVIMLCLIVFSCAGDSTASLRYPDESMMLSRTLSIVNLLPLALRRQAPEFSAACVAIFSALQLALYAPLLTSNMFALLSLYSVVVYGRARRWVWAAVLINVVLFGVKIATFSSGYESIADVLLGIRAGSRSNGSSWEPLAAGGGSAIVLAMLCAGVIALGLWVRASGSNALVLRSREEALRAEREQQKILAANLERDRISASIQAEVTHTLTGVIDQAVAGLRMLDDLESRGEQPSPQDLASAFEDIGARGRSALADMRQLLGVLRETGFSDAVHGGAAHGESSDHDMQLKPAKNLDEQFQTTARTA